MNTKDFLRMGVPLGNATQWGYDLAGNKLTETRADGGVTSSVYDVMNRMVSSTDPLNRTTQMSYDVSGNLVSLTDAKGNVTHWSYDLLNRQIAKTYADNTHDNYGFDAVNNLVTLTNAAGQVTKNLVNGVNTSYTYDNASRLISIVANQGASAVASR